MKTIKIQGMSCDHCVKAVTRALDSIEGIRGVEVSLADGTASFEETLPVDPGTIREVIEKAGYDVV